MPKDLKTSAYNGPNVNEKTPATMQSGFAGLVSGPKMLKTVRIPICWRTGPTCLIAGWYERANKKAKPEAPSTFGTSLASISSRAPNASRTSAEPLVELAARLPCLTTLAPAPAATNAAAVEMLKVSCPSPPVPTMSTMQAWPSRGTSTATACSRIDDASLLTMLGVQRSRFRSARKAPI